MTRERSSTSAPESPSRAESAARRRILQGEHPDRVSPTWPAFGELVRAEGRVLREVTFVMEAEHPAHQTMIHINGVTDSHRTDTRPALLDEVPGSAVRVIAYLLPDDLIASYRFVSLPEIPRDAGATRPGWLRIHDAGRPDARNPRTLPNPLGRTSSVLVMPGAREHPAWNPATPVRREVSAHPVPGSPAFAEHPCTLLIPGGECASGVRRDPRLLVLFDGEKWQALGIAEALARVDSAPAGVVLVSSGSAEERSALLPHPDRVGTLLEEHLLPALESMVGGSPFTADQVVVAGQSYGGLAAAGVVALRPHLATTAIVQSGSFHFTAAEELRPPTGQIGDLVTTVGEFSDPRTLGGRRFIVQSGSEERGMTALAESFAAAAQWAGAQVSEQVYSGGHDYAWWRTGLFDALAERARH